MRFLRALFVLGVLWDPVGQCARAQSPEEAKDGFISMFNGKDFSGWRFANSAAILELPKNWSVADGMIKLSGGGSPHLASQWDYEDFDMRFEWKAHKKGYNSGFYVRSGRAVNANQINLAETDCGHLMGGVPGGKKVPELQKPPGEWNEWRVLAKGDKLTFWCNDKLAWEVTGFKPARGYVGLQAEGAAIDFKNLRIKELGYKPLNDLNAWQPTAGWKQEEGAIFADGNAKALTLAKTPKQFTLRLEYLGDAAIQRGGKTLFALGDTDIKKHATPAPQANYLEINVQKNKVRIWINGQTLSNLRDAPGDAGELSIVPSGVVAMRNIRLRDEK
jgi:3-keto-disaccharide hydrolase